ncbi:MAG TPA: thioester reductase domain-containing protein, partial [Herpetosiphonaceae bacterium]
RVRRALRGYGLAERGLERVEAVAADLSRPLVGLAPARFALLAAECDAIYHNAAVVSLMRGYRSMRDANVGATSELIRLAAAERAAPLHYVSTLAVAPPLAVAPEVPEDFVPFHAGLRDGYQQSKWASERLVEQAMARGLPASVCRLGRVAGPASGAALNPQDLFWQLMGAAARLGLWPAIVEQEAWTPVDQAARAVVRAARSGAGGVFNLAPAAPVRYADLLAWARDYGYELEPCSAAAWRAALERQGGVAGALFELQSEFEAPRIGPIRAERAAAALGSTPVDRALFRRYLDRAVADGLLPAPGLVMAGG